MIRIALVVLAVALVLAAVHLARHGRRIDDQGAAGAALAIAAVAILLAVYAIVRTG